MTKDMHDGASMSASLHCILVMLQRRLFCAVKLFACVKKLSLKNIWKHIRQESLY